MKTLLFFPAGCSVSNYRIYRAVNFCLTRFSKTNHGFVARRAVHQTFKGMDLFFDFSRLRTMSYFLNRNSGVACGRFFAYTLPVHILKITFYGFSTTFLLPEKSWSFRLPDPYARFFNIYIFFFAYPTGHDRLKCRCSHHFVPVKILIYLAIQC